MFMPVQVRVQTPEQRNELRRTLIRRREMHLDRAKKFDEFARRRADHPIMGDQKEYEAFFHRGQVTTYASILELIGETNEPEEAPEVGRQGHDR